MKKPFLCGVLFAGALVSMTGCSSSEDFESLSRDNFVDNVFTKDSSRFVKFDFSSLTVKQRTDLEIFRKLSKSIAASKFDKNNDELTRSISDIYKIDTSDMNPCSPLVKIINAMSDQNVVSALKDNDVSRYLSLLEKKGVLNTYQITRAAQIPDEIRPGNPEAIFFVYGIVAAVAYAAVVADVMVIGPSMANNSEQLYNDIESGSITSLDLGKISDDKESNQLIDTTILEAMKGESTKKVSMTQNIAKSAYNEYM